MSKVSLWLALVLLLALASVALYADNRATRVQELEGSLGEAQQALLSSYESLERLKKSAEVDREEQ